ncbi:MAG: hypothetical protein JXN59_09005 [Anaerolineae bacterium]|nr:hypothetical protein [Anaerolineae bacterium]
MKRSLLLVLPLLVLLAVLAAGCAPGATVEAALQATATPAHNFAEMGVPVGTPQVEEFPTPVMPVLTDASRPDAECVACHSDADQLQLLAEEEEVQESLNEGSG